MPVLRRTKEPMKPAKILVIGFFIIIMTGTLLLTLPFSAKSGEWTGFTDCLFTATSATCVTGIALFDTYTHWTIFGQTIIMLLIQLGGIGFLTVVTFFNLTLGRKMGLLKVRNIVSEFSTEGITTAKGLFTKIIIYSFVLETVGALVLCIDFVPKFDEYGVFMAFFTSISAFCNGGFDLMGIEPGGACFANYTDNPLVLITLSVLIIVGGLGFVVWQNLTDFRKGRILSVHTVTVLVTTLCCIIVGTVLFLAVTFIEPSLSDYSFGEKLLSSFFSSVSSRTCGMVAMPLPTISQFSQFVSILLMFIGAAPASTGGGIKVTTIAIVFATIMSVIRGREDTHLLGHSVKKQVVYKTLTVLALSLAFVLFSFMLIYLTNDSLSSTDILFETVSAFSTTGYSIGVSAECNVFAKYVLILTMYVGRIGPVSLILSLTMNKPDDKSKILPESNLMVG